MVSKKNVSKKNILIYILLFLLIFTLFFLIKTNSNLNVLNSKYNESLQQINSNNLLISNQKKLLQEKDNNISTLISKNIKLNNNIDLLNNKVYEMSNKLNDLENQNTVLSNDYNDLKNNFLSFENEIKESMSWFKTNSNISYLSNSEYIEHNIKKVITCGREYCYINTPYLALINEKVFGIKYASDLSVIGKNDWLQSISEFLDNKKGDCEDYSLLFAAELRYLESYIINNYNKKPIITSIIQSNFYRKFNIATMNGYVYYYKGATRFDYNSEYIYPYVACGNLYDPQTKVINGHCLIMLTNKVINDDNIKQLKGSYLLEPQNGFYSGRIDVSKTINYESAPDVISKITYDVGLIDSNNNPESKIYEFITDNDLYYNNSIYTGADPLDSKWLSYNYFLTEFKKYN